MDEARPGNLEIWEIWDRKQNPQNKKSKNQSQSDVVEISSEKGSIEDKNISNEESSSNDIDSDT